MAGIFNGWARGAAVVVAAAWMTACAGTRPAPTASAPHDSGATVAATPRQVCAAAEQAFIELNLRMTSVEATARGSCALARTPDGETVTVTATSVANGGSVIRVRFAATGDDVISSHLLESIAAHLGAAPPLAG